VAHWWPDRPLPLAAGSGHDHEALTAAFLAEGIDIGRSFPPLNRWARISIGLPEENERAIGVLRKLLLTQP
jgi:histidinol-phosphate aminotransferase